MKKKCNYPVWFPRKRNKETENSERNVTSYNEKTQKISNPKILKQLLQRENKEILKRQKDLTNPQRRAGILKEKHEQANGPETKPLIPRRESLLELNLIYISTPVPVHHLKASDDIWVCPWWKRGMPI